jgi:hypothetical protein
MSPIGRGIFAYTIFDPWGNNSHGKRRHDNTNAIFDTHKVRIKIRDLRCRFSPILF